MPDPSPNEKSPLLYHQTASNYFEYYWFGPLNANRE